MKARLVRISLCVCFHLLVRLAAYSASPWVVRDGGTPANLLGAAYSDQGSGNQVVVVVGEGGVILTSSDDGGSWVRRESGTTETLTAVAFGGLERRCLAVGTGGIILSSTDLITWTREQSPTALRLNAIGRDYFGSGMFAVGEMGVGLLARDATGTWTQSDPGFADRAMFQVAGDSALGERGASFRVRPLGGSSIVWDFVPTGTTSDLRAKADNVDASFGTVVVGGNGYGVGHTAETLRAICIRIGGGITLNTLIAYFSVGEFFAVGTHGVIFRRATDSLRWSPGTAGWMQEVSPTTRDLNAVVSLGNGVLVVGDGGTILFHPKTPVVIVRPPVTGYDRMGLPYVEGDLAGDGAWSYLWVQLTAGAPVSVGTGYPRQLLNQLPGPGRTNPAGETFRLVAANGFGVVAADVSSNRLVNLSGRAAVGAGENILIGGFSTSSSKKVLVRAVGPGLTDFGITGPLKAPRLTVFSGGTAVATNTGWQSSSDIPGLVEAAQRSGAFPLRANSADSALILDSSAGNYTAQVESNDGSAGVALLEIYDLDAANRARLTNLSVRGRVDAGQNLLIGGLVVNGGLKRTFLVRAAGPSLSAFGVQGVLARPRIELLQGNAVVGSGTAWGLGPDVAGIKEATKSVSAFSFPDGSRDAALLAQLDEGAYTVLVSGENGETGVALVEIYEVP